MGSAEDADDETVEKLGNIARHFSRHDVRYVVIGGWSIYQMLPELNYRTNDIDLMIATDDDNYDSIVKALEGLNVRETRGGIPRKEPTTNFNARILASRDHWRFWCDDGIFDLMTDAARMGGFDDLIEAATPVQMRDSQGEVEVLMADPFAVLASKKHADRPKDRKIIGPMEALLSERAAKTAANEMGTVSWVRRLLGGGRYDPTDDKGDEDGDGSSDDAGTSKRASRRSRRRTARKKRARQKAEWKKAARKKTTSGRRCGFSTPSGACRQRKPSQVGGTCAAGHKRQS